MSSRQLRFLPEGATTTLDVPTGVSHLTVDDATSSGVAIQRPTRRRNAAVIEPVEWRGHAHLLLVAPHRSKWRLNGYPVPRVALLRVKDQLQVGDVLLHLTVYQRPHLAAPPPELVGVQCPVCKVPFAADTRVFRCPTCRGAAHLEGENVAPDARLECLLLSDDCPHCQQPIQLDEGYVYEPDGWGEEA